MVHPGQTLQEALGREHCLHVVTQGTRMPRRAGLNIHTVPGEPQSGGPSVRGADCCQDKRGRGDPLNKGKDRAELTAQETNHTSTWRPAHRLHGDHRGADPCPTEEAASLIPSSANARRDRI